MLNASIETVLRTLDCPLTDEDRIAAADEIRALRRQYDELILAVAQKHLGESRHETALRYIRQAEIRQCVAAQAKQEEGK